MKQRLVVLGFAIVGVLCLGLGLAWDKLTSSETYWSPKQYEEFNAAQSDLHKKQRYQQNESEAQRQEFEVAKERFAHISDQLEHAQNSRAHTGTALNILGELAVLVAVFVQWKSGGSE